MLKTGQTLSHFTIRGEISRGGMGIVYRAFDTRLERDIALKVLPPQVVADPQRQRRLVQEARAAAALNHPHIAVVHEIDEADGMTFIAMELIEGHQLSAALQAGRLPMARTLTLAIEIAEGLARAHDRGIVHRDLKPGNVMLTDEGHSKIIDFGLAKLVDSPGTPGMSNAETSDRDRTGLGAVLGTTAYMSPEQARGEPVDYRTDIWSFGVVLYEMATGSRPFQGGSSTDILSAIIRDPTPRFPPLGPDAPPSTCEELQRVVDRCLSKDPGLRFRSMRDVIVDLRSVAQRSGSASVAALPRAPAPARSLAVAGAVIIAVALGIWAFVFRDTGAGGENPAAAATRLSRRSVAVIGFKNLSGRSDADWLSTALSEMFSSELAAGEALRTIPGETVARGRIELALVQTDSFGRETLARIRNNLGCDLVVVGSYLVLGDGSGRKIRLDLQLQDAVLGETVASINEAGTEDQLLELVSGTGARLRERLGVGALNPATVAAVRASLPANQEATRLYAEGLDRLRRFETLAARDLLQQAAASDPNHPLIRSALSEAWFGLGYEDTARQEAQRAFDVSDSLSRENKLFVEARYRVVTRNWQRAVEVYGTLAGFFPDNLEYGLALAGAQTSGGNARAAMATVEKLRGLPTPASLDPRIDLAEASALYSLSDYKRAQTVAARAATKGSANGAPLLVARARLQEGNAFDHLGEESAALAAAAEAEQLFSAAGDVAGLARSQFLAAVLLRGQGKLAEARALSERILASGRKVGDQRTIASTVTQLAIIQSQQGDLAGSIVRLREVLDIYRRIADKPGISRTLNNLAASLQLSGSLDEAAAMYEESLAIGRESGDRNAVGFALNNLAEVRETKAEIKEAQRLYEEALGIRRDLGFKEGVGYTGARLGNLLIAQDQLAAARVSLEESLKIRTELGATADVAETRLFLSTLAIEEGRPADGESLARQARTAFQQEKMTDREAAAEEQLGRALLAQSRVADARAAIDRGRTLAGGSQDRYVEYAVRLTAARMQAAAGQRKEAQAALQQLRADTERAGFSEVALQARHALGEIQALAGDRALLDQVRRDAEARGYLLIARKSAR